MKLRYLRWTVTPNGKSLVYVNVIQNAGGRLENVPDSVFSAIVAGQRLKFFQIIRNNIFIHFAKSWRLSFSEMHAKKVGGVSWFVQQTHTNIVWALWTHFW